MPREKNIALKSIIKCGGKIMHKTNCPVSQGKITYATLPDGTADVWIRKNETQLPESEEGPQGVEADEIYFKVTVDTVTKEEISADIDFWFDQLKELSLIHI